MFGGWCFFRSPQVGLYARTQRRPIQYQEFLKSASGRQRYWARNFVGWPEFSSRQPNSSHFALCDMEKSGKLLWLVTQNVDALHTKAGSRKVKSLRFCEHRSLRMRKNVHMRDQHLSSRGRLNYVGYNGNHCYFSVCKFTVHVIAVIVLIIVVSLIAI